jgi:hypothetical protein
MSRRIVRAVLTIVGLATLVYTIGAPHLSGT